MDYFEVILKEYAKKFGFRVSKPIRKFVALIFSHPILSGRRIGDILIKNKEIVKKAG
ncbi:MAG: hypothetical protein ACETVT_01145 [bacterium]